MYDMNLKKTNAMKKLDEYGMKISSDMVNDIKKMCDNKKVSLFIQNHSNIQNLKPFKLKKNNEESNIFSKFDGAQEHSSNEDEIGIEE